MTDVQESMHYAVYIHTDNRILVFADDTTPRWTTASTMVDYDTVAGGDKFGNFFVNRLPTNISHDVDEDTTGSRIMHEKGYLQGAPNKVRFWLRGYEVDGDIDLLLLRWIMFVNTFWVISSHLYIVQHCYPVDEKSCLLQHCLDLSTFSYHLYHVKTLNSSKCLKCICDQKHLLWPAVIISVIEASTYPSNPSSMATSVSSTTPCHQIRSV